ncbi:MAG: hypothetical protein Fur0020_08250 [Thermodesulfovibrionia bacterium]
MGCSTCHSDLDTKDIPHKVKGKIAKGLSSDVPELCYNCHDKAGFENKVVHAAVSMGCTSCHNPHSSKNTKLLLSEPPELCYNCHDKTAFSKKVVHVPVEGGMCLSCHTPHSGEVETLLLKRLNGLCGECHLSQTGSHVIAGIGKKTTHPIDKVPDPKRPGKEMSCVSCHNPHSSDIPTLFQQERICRRCHAY